MIGILWSIAMALGGASTVSAANFPTDPDLQYFAGDSTANTVVTIQSDTDGKAKFYINGELTYAGDGVPVQSLGMLTNNRSVQATIDDMDGNIDPDWHDSGSGKPQNNFLNAGVWDPKANTERFIASLAAWKSYGVIAHTLNFQGGCQCTEGISGGDQRSHLDNNPFGAHGTKCFDDWWANNDTAHARYLARLGSVIRAADDMGIVVILGLFYFGQDDRLDNEAAVLAATDAAVDWIIANGFTNVVLEIGNESGTNNFYAKHPILQADRVHELVDRVHELTDQDGTGDSTGFDKNPGFSFPQGMALTSVSGLGGYQPPQSWLTRVDFVLLHGNGVSISGITGMVNTARNDINTARGDHYALPVVFNEDDGQSQNGPNLGNRLANLNRAYDAEASWGLYYDYYHQSIYPPRWEPWGNAQVVADEYKDVLGISDNLAPVADAGADLKGAAGVSVVFDGSNSTDPDGGPSSLSYDWDFGDGTVLEDGGDSPSHDFLQAGVYTVTMTVSDGLAQDSDTLEVAVGSDVIAKDNFDDGDGLGWNVQGNDSVSNNALQHVGGGVSALVGLGTGGTAGENLADVRISAMVQLAGSGNGWVGVGLRRSDIAHGTTGSGYLVFIRQTGNVSIRVNTATPVSYSTATTVDPLTAPVNLVIEAVGSSIKVWVNGGLVLDETDNNFTSGSLALCSNSLDATIDDVEVTSPLATHVYGTPETQSGGGQAIISTSGTPSVGGTFAIKVSGLQPSIPGLLFYGSNGAADMPFNIGNWYGWTAGVTRLPVKFADANGEVTYNISEIDAVAGTTMAYQFWYRDPAQSDGAAVSNAVRVDFE